MLSKSWQLNISNLLNTVALLIDMEPCDTDIENNMR